MFRFALRKCPTKFWSTKGCLISTITTTTTTAPATHYHLLRFLHKTPQDPAKSDPSSTISYLVNSCGLTPQSAIATAQKISIKTPENADSILNFLKTQGITNTQIAELVAKYPRVLLCSLENTIKPKLDYFATVGFSGPEVAELICSCPFLVKVNLENRLKPNFEVLRSVIGDNQRISTALRRSTWLLSNNLEASFLPNVKTLQSYGVSPRDIGRLASLYPRVAMQAPEQFAETVRLIRELGFDPSSGMFFQGVSAMSGLSRPMWERKVAIYKSVGWSEQDVISAFIRHPFCMLLSEEKIRRVMDFFVNKLHWEPSVVAARPVILCLNLERRVMRRCSVINILASKRLVKEGLALKFLLVSEENFLNRYVIKYERQVPEVRQAYNGNMEFFGFKGESAVI